MNDTLLLGYLSANLDPILARWAEHFCENAGKCGLPVGQVTPQSLILIYEDLSEVLEGKELERLRPLSQDRVLFKSEENYLNFPTLIELFISLEEVLRARIFGGPDALPEMPPITRRITFEQLSGTLHLLLDFQSQAFCGSCIEPLAVACTKLASRKKVSQNLLQTLTENRLTHHRRHCRDRANLPAAEMEEPEIEPWNIHLSDSPLVRFFRIHARNLQERWLEEAAEDPALEGIPNLQEAVEHLFHMAERRAHNSFLGIPIDIPGPLPQQSGLRLLRLCHVGEETIAVELALSPEAITARGYAPRIELNDVFHDLIRTHCISACSRCRKKIDQGKEVLEAMQPVH